MNLSRSRLESLYGQGGAGGRLLEAKGEQVAALARRYSAGHGSIPAGIVVGPVVAKTVKITSTNIHSLFVHEGTSPHRIVPRRRGGVLRFQVGGRTVYARAVNHPGNRADKFLTRALRDAL